MQRIYAQPVSNNDLDHQHRMNSCTETTLMEDHDTQFPEVKRHAVLPDLATRTPHDMTAHINACSQPTGDAEHQDCLDNEYSEGELDNYEDYSDDWEATLFG